MNALNVSATGGLSIVNMNNSNAIAINAGNMNHMSSGIMSDDISEPSSPESTSFDASDLLNSSVNDDVTAQLAAAGKKDFSSDSNMSFNSALL